MIRLLPLLLALTGCPELTLIDSGVDAGCIEAAGQCDDGPVCVPVEDAMSTGVMYAWQCGGSGDATDPGDADDCIEAETYTIGDPAGDLVCARCEDLDGDGPSSANPWPYLILGVCEFSAGAR